MTEGILFWAFYVFMILVLIVISLFAFLPFFFGAPWEPTSRDILEKMVKFSKPRRGDKVVDLGSGTGTIIIEFAKNPNIKEVHGYEINPFLYFLSKIRIKRLGLQKKVFVHYGNFMNKDLSKFNIVTIFQIFSVMGKIERKLKKELKKGSRIVSNTWKLKGLKPVRKSEKHFLKSVYLYKI